MKQGNNKHIWVRALLVMCIFMLTGTQQSNAQRQLTKQIADSLKDLIGDTLVIHDTLVTGKNIIITDSMVTAANQSIDSLVESTLIGQVKKAKPMKDMSLWRPDPKRALWLALVIPGGGQIYNRKYWKLPLVYGGFVGCLYAMNWNNTMYKDYSQAYLDLMDNDPATQSYNQFLHLGAQIDKSNKDRYTDIFRKRKDRFRRWRDLSFFVLVGVYALSVVDAYVDAELSVFDISKDLSLKVEPTILNNHSSSNPLDASSLGLQCSLNF